MLRNGGAESSNIFSPMYEEQTLECSQTGLCSKLRQPTHVGLVRARGKFSLHLFFTEFLRSPYAEHNVDDTTLIVVQGYWTRYSPRKKKTLAECFDSDYLSRALYSKMMNTCAVIELFSFFRWSKTTPKPRKTPMAYKHPNQPTNSERHG